MRIKLSNKMAMNINVETSCSKEGRGLREMLFPTFALLTEA